MKNLCKKINKYVPVASMVIIPVGLIVAIVNIAAIKSSRVADFWNDNIASVIRKVLAWLTGWIPFSIAEFLLFGAVVIIPIIVVAVIRYSERKGFVKALVGLLSVFVLLYAVFASGLGIGYRTTKLDERMELVYHEVTAEDLYNTAMITVERLNELESEIKYIRDVGSTSGLSYDDIVELCAKSYDRLSEEYSFIKSFRAPVKRIILSPYMTYTHISGVYNVFTGEANVNTNYPEYVKVYTIAHEMAHQRGIARENEANFIAYLVCVESDDPYMRYSGYLNMYEYLTDALYEASHAKYSRVSQKLCNGAKYDLKCFSNFFKKYSDNVVADVSDAVNDAYLTSQGTEGSRSYGLVVDLAVAYYKSETEK